MIKLDSKILKVGFVSIIYVDVLSLFLVLGPEKTTHHEKEDLAYKAR